MDEELRDIVNEKFNDESLYKGFISQIVEDETSEVSIDDMNVILVQLWKSRKTDPQCNDLYEKYKALIPVE